jgi:uncharacterized integral membrane protein
MAQDRSKDDQFGERSIDVKAIVAIAIGVLLLVFAVVNLNDVKVDWVVATWEVPLIVVIVVSGLLGALIAGLIRRRREKSR